jgi:type II secretory pathway component PulJ
MYIRTSTKKCSGWSLLELLIASAIFTTASTGLLSLYLFTSSSFAGLSDYATLDKANRQAMDMLTKEIRQAKAVTSCSTNPPSITVLRGDGLTVKYSFSKDKQQMIRDVSDGTHQVLLNHCSLLSFSLCQRNPVGGSYDIYPAATDNWQQTVKVIQLSWKTACSLPYHMVSENVQTARIVIRKQDDGV